jgi:hypothetical protein
MPEYEVDNWRRNWYFGLYGSGTVREIGKFDTTAIRFGLEYHILLRTSCEDEWYVDAMATRKWFTKMPYHDALDGIACKKISPDSRRVMSGKSSGTFVFARLTEEYYNMCIKSMCKRFTFTELAQTK